MRTLVLTTADGGLIFRRKKNIFKKVLILSQKKKKNVECFTLRFDSMQSLLKGFYFYLSINTHIFNDNF